jgi:hypothetical protein
MDRVVCRLSSVLCSLEIVKRVVTVKQVRPSPLRRGEVGPGAWVCVLPVREHRQGAAVLRSGPGWRKEVGRDGLTSVPCHLTCDLACLGLGAGAAREGHLVDALVPRGDEGRGTLRKAEGRGERPVILGCPNGATHRFKR